QPPQGDQHGRARSGLLHVGPDEPDLGGVIVSFPHGPSAVRPKIQSLTMRTRTTLRLLLLLLALALVQGCSTYRVRRDERWHQDGPPWGVFDVYEPRSDAGGKARPAILAIHGGAWMSGDKRGIGEDVARIFCPRGYVVFSMNYRLAPEHRWPQQLRDCQAALRHIRERAEAFGIDPARIAAFGVSAGGHLATMLALRED